MKQSIGELARKLDQAALNATATNQLSLNQALSLDDAYTIQAFSMEGRYERGEQLTGYKLGFTSKAKMEQMGVHDIIWGRLTSQMHHNDGDTLNLRNFIHPRVEPEIAFRICKTIDSLIDRESIHDYFDGVAGALEIIDSRYENFKFSLEDVIADNCSSAAYVVGEWLSADTPVQDVKIELIINDEVAQSGSSDAILGDPVNSLVELSKMAEKYNLSIPAGSVVLAGAATSAVYIKENDTLKGVFENIGEVTLKAK